MVFGVVWNEPLNVDFIKLDIYRACPTDDPVQVEKKLGALPLVEIRAKLNQGVEMKFDPVADLLNFISVLS